MCMLHMSIANETREWCNVLQKEGHVAVMCSATHGACKQNRKTEPAARRRRSDTSSMQRHTYDMQSRPGEGLTHQKEEDRRMQC